MGLLEHYKEIYHHTVLAFFVQSLETGGGTYNPHFAHVMISLKSGTALKDFFRRLFGQAPAVQSLDVTLGWDFRSADLVTFVDMVSKSNGKVVKLDLQDDHSLNLRMASLRAGKGCYHSLHGLLSNTKLRSLQFSNLCLLRTRTSNLSSGFSASGLQSFCFYGQIKEDDRSRLTYIISHCSQPVNVRPVTQVWCSMGLSLYQDVFSLQMLRRLHLSGWDLPLDQGGNTNDLRPMKEIVYRTALKDDRVLTKTIQQSGPVLEVLVLYSYGPVVDIAPEDPSPSPLINGREGVPAEPLSNVLHFSALTHLDLLVRLTDSSLKSLSTILPRLDLIHFGCHCNLHGLLQHCNFASLKSLSIMYANDTDLKLLLDAMGDGTAIPIWDGLEQLYIREVMPSTKVPTHFLQSAQLTRLYLEYIESTPLAAILKAVNPSKLQEISIRDCEYLLRAE